MGDGVGRAGRHARLILAGYALLVVVAGVFALPVFSELGSDNDFDDPHELAKFAATVGMSLEEFRKQFEYLVDQEPPPLEMDAKGEAHGAS